MYRRHSFCILWRFWADLERYFNLNSASAQRDSLELKFLPDSLISSSSIISILFLTVSKFLHVLGYVLFKVSTRVEAGAPSTSFKFSMLSLYTEISSLSIWCLCQFIVSLRYDTFRLLNSVSKHICFWIFAKRFCKRLSFLFGVLSSILESINFDISWVHTVSRVL